MATGKSPECTYKFDINDYVEIHIRVDEPGDSGVWRFNGGYGRINNFDHSIDDPPQPMYRIIFDDGLTTTEGTFFEDELTLVNTVDVKALLELL